MPIPAQNMSIITIPYAQPFITLVGKFQLSIKTIGNRELEKGKRVDYQHNKTYDKGEQRVELCA